MSVRPCYSEDVQASAGTLHPCTGESGGSTGADTALVSYLGASAGTLHPCTGESGGSTGADTALVSYLGYSFSSCTLAVSPKGQE